MKRWIEFDSLTGEELEDGWDDEYSDWCGCGGSNCTDCGEYEFLHHGGEGDESEEDDGLSEEVDID